MLEINSILRRSNNILKLYWKGQLATWKNIRDYVQQWGTINNVFGPCYNLLCVVCCSGIQCSSPTVVLVFSAVLQQFCNYALYCEIGRGNWLLGRVLKIMYSNGSLKLCTCCEFGRGN